MNLEKKVVAGYNGGITGPYALLGFAISTHNQRADSLFKSGRRMEIHNYPVAFSDGSGDVAFDVSVSVSLPGTPEGDRFARDEAGELLKKRAEELARIFNAGVDALAKRGKFE